MKLYIGITSEQHDDLIRLLCASVAQNERDAAALLSVRDLCENAHELALERLRDARAADELISLLAEV